MQEPLATAVNQLWSRLRNPPGKRGRTSIDFTMETLPGAPDPAIDLPLARA